MKHIRRIEIVQANDYPSLESKINRICREELVVNIQVLQDKFEGYIAMVSIDDYIQG